MLPSILSTTPAAGLRSRAIVLWALFSALLATIGAVQPAAAQALRQPKEVIRSKQPFGTSRGVFVGAGFEYGNVAGEFARWLRSQGVAASNTRSRGQSEILFQHLPRIEGIEGADALYISIKARRITVTFTSRHALEYAVRLLQSTLITDAGPAHWAGGTIMDWSSRTATRTRESTVDAATRMQPLQEMEGTLRQQATTTAASSSAPAPRGRAPKEVYVTFVSSQKWRMQSPSLEAAGLTAELYPPDGYYSADDLLQIDRICRLNHVEMIPTLELLSENAPFTQAFGHSIFSVEGMRLVRAAMEDCVELLHPRKICLGVLSSQVDMRYLEFVSGVAQMLGVELIVIE